MKLLAAPLAAILWPIVVYDYRQRRLGYRPDEWHWADRLLLRLGYAVEL